MRIVVFGASGRTGRHVVEQALERGYAVTAFVRRPEEFDLVHDELRVIAGDVLDRDAVARAVRGSDAVVCVLGPTRTSPPDTCSAGTRNIVAAMEHHGVRRLLCVTGAMIGHPREKLVGWIYRGMSALLPRSQREQLDERRQQEAVVEGSELDWTLVRPPRLSKERLSRNYRAAEGLVLDSFAHIGRADLAHFLLEQLDSARFVRRGVAVSY